MAWLRGSTRANPHPLAVQALQGMYPVLKGDTFTALVASFGMVLAHQIMSILPNTQDADNLLVWIYRLLPGYNFGEAVIRITTTFYQNQLLVINLPPFSFFVIGMPCALMR